jgi:hypothetical protein
MKAIAPSNSRIAAAIRGWFAASLRIVCAWQSAVLLQASGHK